MDVPAPTGRCSAIARDLDEALYGTAPTSESWILVEQPGPWGRDALTESSIDSEVAAELSRRSTAYGFRVLLLRRNAARQAGASRVCFLVRTSQSQTWMERVDLDKPSDILDIEPGALSKSTPPGVGVAAGSLWAVCTHGRRDPCCAEYGRRLIRLGFDEERLQKDLWESSHQGGHRFAANLALFPHGLFYGHVEPDGARRIVEAHRNGRIVLDGYRGRSAFDEVTQAADFMVRREVGFTGIDDLVPVRKHDLGDGRYAVAFNGVMGTLTLTLEMSDGPMRPESCNKPKLTPVRVFRQLELTPYIGESPTV